MALVAEFVRAWRDPAAVMEPVRQGPVREDRALAMIMAAAAVIFVAGWPQAARQAALDPSVPLQARLGAALLVQVFVVPLLAYGVAGISHLICRAVLRAKGRAYGARVALFRALLTCGPLFLANGLVVGLAGPGSLAATVVGLLVLLAFVYLWITLLKKAYSR